MRKDVWISSNCKRGAWRGGWLLKCYPYGRVGRLWFIQGGRELTPGKIFWQPSGECGGTGNNSYGPIAGNGGFCLERN